MARLSADLETSQGYYIARPHELRTFEPVECVWTGDPSQVRVAAR